MSDLISRKALLEELKNTYVPVSVKLIDLITNAPTIEQGETVNRVEIVNSLAVERKLIYQVYEAEVNDCFKFIGAPLLETDDLGRCCVMCYDLSKELTHKRFVTWQENIQALRENCCELDRFKEK